MVFHRMYTYIYIYYLLRVYPPPNFPGANHHHSVCKALHSWAEQTEDAAWHGISDTSIHVKKINRRGWPGRPGGESWGKMIKAQVKYHAVCFCGEKCDSKPCHVVDMLLTMFQSTRITITGWRQSSIWWEGSMVHDSNQDATSLCISSIYKHRSICKELPSLGITTFNQTTYIHTHILYICYTHICIYTLIVLAQLSLSRPVFVNPKSLNCIAFCA